MFCVGHKMDLAAAARAFISQGEHSPTYLQLLAGGLREGRQDKKFSGCSNLPVRGGGCSSIWPIFMNILMRLSALSRFRPLLCESFICKETHTGFQISVQQIVCYL